MIFWGCLGLTAIFILAYVVDVIRAQRGVKNNKYWRGMFTISIYHVSINFPLFTKYNVEVCGDLLHGQKRALLSKVACDRTNMDIHYVLDP